MLPQELNPRNFNVDLGMAADALHNLLGRRFLKVDGLAISLDYRVLRRLHGWRKSENVLVKQDDSSMSAAASMGLIRFAMAVLATTDPL